MKKVDKLIDSEIYQIRNAGKDSGLAHKLYGRYENIKDYSREEIKEMMNGIYRDTFTLKVDDEYFINLNDVTEAVCLIESAEYKNKPEPGELIDKSYNSINNIKSFYIKDYFLITDKEYEGTQMHAISKFLCKMGSIKLGKDEFAGLYKNENTYKHFQKFIHGSFPKDLFHPIKVSINELFFLDSYRISNFKVIGKIQIEK